MNQSPLNRPVYLCKPIGSAESLAKALGCDLAHLSDIACRASNLYRLAKPIVKADGSIRQPFDALPALKNIHRRLKSQIFSKVSYPAYLTGSLKGKDYKTNAELHIGSKFVICEDIKNFFPSVTSDLIFDIWRRFFNFPPTVAGLLTELTTKDGALPQGAIPSSFLANLALWDVEPALQRNFAERGIVYSRYVDDIALSSKSFVDKSTQTELIAAVYGMLAGVGLQAKRSKHESFSSSERMMNRPVFRGGSRL